MKAYSSEQIRELKNVIKDIVSRNEIDEFTDNGDGVIFTVPFNSTRYKLSVIYDEADERPTAVVESPSGRLIGRRNLSELFK